MEPGGRWKGDPEEGLRGVEPGGGWMDCRGSGD